MRGYDFDVEHRLAIPGITVELRRYRLVDRPIRTDVHQPYYLCDLALTPRPVARVDAGAGTDHGDARIGPMLLVPPRYPIDCRSAPGVNRSLVCMIDEATFGRLAGARLESGISPAALLDIRDAQLAHAFRRLMMEIRSPGLASAALTEAIAAMMAIDLVRYFAGGAGPEASSSRRLTTTQLAAIRDTIEAHRGPGPTVTELAAVCGLSARHLLRCFRQATGNTVAQYITEVRLEQAMRYLGETRLQAKEIAYRVGFSNASSFAQAFRRHTGLSPVAYRYQRMH